jgi:hypothetical protein
MLVVKSTLRVIFTVNIARVKSEALSRLANRKVFTLRVIFATCHCHISNSMFLPSGYPEGKKLDLQLSITVITFHQTPPLKLPSGYPEGKKRGEKGEELR